MVFSIPFNHWDANELRDQSAMPLLKAIGRQYQKTWEEKANPKATLVPYRDQSAIPLIQAAMSIPTITVHENFEDQQSRDLGFTKGGPPP